MPAHSSASSLNHHGASPFAQTKARQLLGWFFIFQVTGGLLVFLVGIFAQPLIGVRPDDPIWMAMTIYAGWALFGWWIVFYLRARNVSMARIIGSTHCSGREWGEAALVAIACLIFSTGVGLLMFELLDTLAPEFSEQLMQSSSLSQPSQLPFVQNLLFTGLLVIVAPTIEEFLFRGLLLHRWTWKWSLVVSVLISSLVFGLLHIVNPMGLTMFGVMMSLLYLKTSKLAVPVIAHAINNSVVALALWLPQTEPPEPSESNLIAGIVCLCIAVPLLGWLAYRLWSKRTAAMPYEVNLLQVNLRSP